MGLDTLENVKARLGISDSSYDAFLQNQIDVISDTIEAYCRRKFAQASYVQTFYRRDYRASHQLTLFHFPVTRVAKIIEDGIESDADDGISSPQGIRLNKPTGILTRLHDYFNAYWFCADVTEIHYQAGYEDIPSQILYVLDSLVNEAYLKQKSGVGLGFGNNVQSVSIPGSVQITFDYTSAVDSQSTPFGMILGNYLNTLDFFRSERSIVNKSELIYIEDDTEDDGDDSP